MFQSIVDRTDRMEPKDSTAGVAVDGAFEQLREIPILPHQHPYMLRCRIDAQEGDFAKKVCESLLHAVVRFLVFSGFCFVS